MKLNVNNTIEEVFSYTQEQVNKYIELTGDDNPIHHDIEYSQSTIFKRPIVHGMLSASIFSKILGTKMPGMGTIYIKQELNFIRPVYINEQYTARVMITKIEASKFTLDTIIKDKKGNPVLTGQAIVINTQIDEK